MVRFEERKISLQKHNLKLILQALTCLIFICSCILITFGCIHATFVPSEASEEALVYPLVTKAAQENCDRFSGVYLGIPGAIIGLLGLCLIGILVPKQWALRLALVHLFFCIAGFIFNTVMMDVEVHACLKAKSAYLREFYEKENNRKENYLKVVNWQNDRAKWEFPEVQFPYATYTIIAVNIAILITAVIQIAAYLISALILAGGLGYAAYLKKSAGAESGRPHEIETFETHTTTKSRYVPKE